MVVVSISCLGNWGRFGNQLHQYAFARAFAEHHNAILQTPKWIGQELFGLNDPPITTKLPCLGHDVIPPTADVDLYGYFQHKSHLDYLSRTKLKEWFQFQSRWVNHKQVKIAAHLRRGDYATASLGFCMVSMESYKQAAKNIGIDPNEITWLSEETQSASGPYGFVEDFTAMVNAAILLRANSTFSWWAGVLGDGKVYAPIVKTNGLQTVEFVEGNYPRIHPSLDELHLKP